MYKLKKSSSRGYYDTPTRVRSRAPRIRFALFTNRFKKSRIRRWWI